MDFNGKLVVVRSYASGVHVGVLVSQNERVVELTAARRLWRWYGANTLSEVALHGVDLKKDTRLSEPVDIRLLDAIEIIPVAEEAAASLTTTKGPK